MYETEKRDCIIKHKEVLCRGMNNDIDLIERVMSSRNTPQVQLCPYCEKGFSINGYRNQLISECRKLNNPEKVSTKQWECRLCGKCYMLKSSAISHIRTIMTNQISVEGEKLVIDLNSVISKKKSPLMFPNYQ